MNPFTPPIPVSRIWEFAPHRPPLVWVDEVLAFSATSGTCALTLKEGGYYLSPGRGLRPSSCVEFVAQAYLFTSICHHQTSDDPLQKAPQRAFLASIKDATFAEAMTFQKLAPGDRLEIEITGARQLGPITLFRGQVYWKRESATVRLCSTQLKVFSE